MIAILGLRQVLGPRFAATRRNTSQLTEAAVEAERAELVLGAATHAIDPAPDVDASQRAGASRRAESGLIPYVGHSTSNGQR